MEKRGEMNNYLPFNGTVHHDACHLGQKR